MTPRFAIVGTGFIAASHAQAIAASGGVLTTVVDANQAAALTFATRWGAQTATFGDMLANPEVDAVILCTPNDTHAPMALEVAAAGKHLLLEKPMALEVADAVAVREAFAGADRRLLVGHTHRHSDVGRTVAGAIAEGRLGTVRNLRIAITGGWIWGGWHAWVLDSQRSGGHAFHNGVHLYDLARWWLGSPIERVFAQGQGLTSAALDFDDYLCATLVAESGAAAVCEISRGEHPRTTSAFEIVVHGERGSLVRRWTSDGLVTFTAAASGPRGLGTSDPFARQLAGFSAAITDGAPLDPDPALAVHATAVAAATRESARTGTTVEVLR